MNAATITFTADGWGHGIYSEAIDLSLIGALEIHRATSIEFDNQTQYWRVYDPTGFPMFSAPRREACLDWERQYLQAQEDLKHDELQHGAGATTAGT